MGAAGLGPVVKMRHPPGVVPGQIITGELNVVVTKSGTQ
jgi:hypothetical protein